MLSILRSRLITRPLLFNIRILSSNINKSDLNTSNIIDQTKYINDLNRSSLIKLLDANDNLAKYLNYDVDYYIKIMLIKKNVLNVQYMKTIDNTILDYIIDRKTLLEIYIKYFEQEIQSKNIIPNNDDEFTKSSIELLNENPLNINKINNINLTIINHAKQLNNTIIEDINNKKKLKNITY